MAVSDDGRAPDRGDEEARAGRGDFLGFVAHEVRNPLSTALWSAELLARMAGPDRAGPRGEKLTAMCLRSLARVRQLVEDHLLGERLEAGGIPLRAEPVVLEEVLAELAQRRPDDVGAAALDVTPGLSLTVDRSLLERALEALLNAAGREQAPVQLTAREKDGCAELRIRGGPLPPEPLADPRKGSASDPRGRALALPMARRVAGALGASLAVEDGGFVLTVPREPAHAPRAAGSPGAHP